MEPLDFGAYSKGSSWKYGARTMGGSIGWFLLLVGFSVGGAFFFLIFGLVIAAALSFRRGLSAHPHTGPAGIPHNIGFRIQDKVGDWALTLMWRAIRAQTGPKYD